MDSEIKKLKEEIQKNYKAFSEKKFPKSDTGKFVVLKDTEIIAKKNTKEEAMQFAEKTIKDKIYSIQQINPQKVDLGFASYALRTS